MKIFPQNDPNSSAGWSVELDRFVAAQADTYDAALSELRQGRKTGHWMWFIFPQLDGLGKSSTSRFYAIRSAEEAKAYLEHPVLGQRLKQCCEALLACGETDVGTIFGSPDDLKLRSCLTLFRSVAAPGSIFERVLERFFQGEPDRQTEELLKRR
jgi:uncharacterized protein (DUF1810 family)